MPLESPGPASSWGVKAASARQRESMESMLLQQQTGCQRRVLAALERDPSFPGSDFDALKRYAFRVFDLVVSLRQVIHPQGRSGSGLLESHLHDGHFDDLVGLGGEDIEGRWSLHLDDQGRNAEGY